ncbi:alkaline phosphatase D family protein [Sphingorhabdus sp. 109]|uniref:alkaline phosphatase D family protein n=1 Tax=Sphingorhabdus sp. 109 TaxID=2653173 RepID=UPI0012F1791A|nr:alkaline phosphatase D family protein [Sphingorhabdus sp. 109]VWX60267.1 conserved hypothetical protein [Sphingorhabdus sp. 109]
MTEKKCAPPSPTFPPLSRRSLLRASAIGPTLLMSGSLDAAPRATFTHSVASGDPEQRSVTLWTRYVSPDAAAVWLQVEVAEDEQFERIVFRSSALSSPDRDFCVHTRPEKLKPGTYYYYRFRAANGDVSPTGRTRTLPEGRLERFRIGVFSCANATSGWFNAYAHAAARDDLDLLVHLGDYIYESKLSRSDALEGMAELRGIEPPHEVVSLSDYRKRYASYRADPALQELHRRFPAIVMWDDHETVNNSWTNGAANHDPASEGRWTDRMAAGVQAFYEWLPMREKPYSEYQLGDLATLFRLETRLTGRTEQLDLKEAINDHGEDIAAAAMSFRDGPLNDPTRSMMGAGQEQWLAESLATSTASGTKWQILAQQVIMGRSRMPEDFEAFFGPGDRPSNRKLAEMERAARLAAIGVPIHMDRWEGYPAARRRLLQASQNAEADLVVLSGDSHNAWAFNLDHNDQPVGVELAVQGVSSLGMDKRYHGDPATIAKRFVDANPDLVWCDTSQRGYMVLDIEAERIVNEWLFIPSRFARTAEVSATHRMQVTRGSRRLSFSE